MRGLEIMSWFYVIFFLSFAVSSLEAASGKKQLQSAVVVGTVYCDTCFQQYFSKPSHFISGATVAVECKDETSKSSFRQEAKTDEHGEFKVRLPFSVSKHVRKIKRCSVNLINSSEPYCAVASTATSSSLHLKSREQGTHIFSAGFFTFKPLKQPNLCNQKPSLKNSEQFNPEKFSLTEVQDTPTFPPPLQDPTTPDLPPGGPTNLPPLPPLPSLPPLPALPPLPPLSNSLQPPPHFPPLFPPLPPHPLFPVPSPGVPSPPIPGLTPPPPIPGLTPPPPIPGLTPPPPPSYPFPLPPFQLPPRFPGIP